MKNTVWCSLFLMLGLTLGCSSEKKEEKVESVQKEESKSIVKEEKSEQKNSVSKNFSFTPQDFLNTFKKFELGNNRFSELNELPEDSNSYYFTDNRYGVVNSLLVDENKKVKAISIVKMVKEKDLIQNNLIYKTEIMNFHQGVVVLIKNIGRFNTSSTDSLIHGDEFIKEIVKNGYSSGTYENINLRMVKPKKASDMVVITYVITPHSK